MIFTYLAESSVKNIGISTCINSYRHCSHQAVIKARNKLGENLFKEVNFNINKNYLSPNHIYAIDGSKIKVHNCFKNYGYNTRTCDKIIKKPAKKPLAMLSSLIGITL